MNGFLKGTKRRPDGTFAPGTAPGPGRPRGSGSYRRLRELIRARIDDTTFAQIVDTLATQAIAGDVQCARLLLHYLIGKPRDESDLLHDAEFAEQFPSFGQEQDSFEGTDWSQLDTDDDGGRFVPAAELLASLPEPL